MIRRWLRHGWLAAFLAAVAALPTASQVQVRVQAGGAPLDNGKPEPPPAYPSDQAIVRALDDAKKHRSQKALPDAVAALQKILNQPEETWVQGGEKQWRSARAAAEQMLLDDPALLNEYRDRYEPEAKAELKEAGDDAGKIAAVVRRFFLTPSGSDAAERLATMLLDAGRPTLALVHLERLLECPAHKQQLPPTLKLKASLARRLLGEPEAKRDADASAMFAGQATTSGKLLSEVDARWRESTKVLSDWPTPTGDASRTARSGGGLPLLGAESTGAGVPISDQKKLLTQFDRIAERNRHKSRATYFGAQPIVVGDVAFARTCRGVESVDLRTGKPHWPAPYMDGVPFDKQELMFDEWEEAGRMANAASLESFLLGNTMYGAIVSDGKRLYLVDEVYAQPGSYNLFMLGRDKADATRRVANRLTALDVATGKPGWRLGGSEARKINDPDGQVFFFGPPTPIDGKLYVLVEAQSEVALWEIDPAGGRPNWKQRLMLMHRRVDADPFRRSQACTIVAAEGIAICPTNTSRLFAVDLVSRTVLWERNFESDLAQRAFLNFNFIDVAPPPDNPHIADPPIVVGGRVVFQGPNLHGVHCLDLRTGRTIWRKERGGDQHVAGVQNGKVVLVGGARLRALNLSDGEDVWVAAAPMPSGRGAFADGKYLLPTERGDCLAFEVATGKPAGASYSIDHPARPLGNLAAARDALAAVGRHGFRTFPLVDLIRRDAGDALAKRPKDARGMYLSGLVAIHEQRMTEAADLILDSLQTNQPFAERGQASRMLLRLASEENLAKFPKVDALLVELRRSATEPKDQAAVLRLEAGAFLNAKRWTEALVAAEKQAMVDPTFVPSLHDAPARDPWLWARSFARKVFAAAPTDQHPAIAADVERRHLNAFESPDVEELRRLTLVYDRQGIGRRARLEIGRRQLARRRFDMAALAYTAALRTAVGDEEKAAARSGLSAVADAGRLPRDSFWHLERWKQEAPGARDADGRTVDQAMQEWTKSNGSAAKPADKPRQWPLAAVRMEVVSSPERRSYLSRHWIKPVSAEFPYFDRRGFAFRQGETGFASFDFVGCSSEHETTVGEELLRAGLGTIQGTAPVLGYMYFAALDEKAAAISVLDRGAAVWSSSPGTPELEGEELDLAFEWSQPRENRSDESKLKLGPVGPDFLIARSAKELAAVDPATGRPLWRRSDATKAHRVFGDAERLYLVNAKGEFTCVRPDDGEVLSTGVWDWFNPKYTEAHCRGRFVLRTRDGLDQLDVSLWDAATDRTVWKRSFPKGARRWVVSASAPIAVAPSNDRVEILSPDTGESACSFAVADLTQRSSIKAFTQGEFIFVAVEHSGGRVFSRGSISGVEDHAVHGRLVALRRGGDKPLWERPMQEARIVGWPLDSLPILVVLETLEPALNVEALATRFRVLEKSTGRILVETTLSNEMQMIHDVAIDGRRSRVEFTGFSKKLQLWFPDPNRARKKETNDPTVGDVFDLFGKLSKKVVKEPAKPKGK